jgi:hypothetical protein
MPSFLKRTSKEDYSPAQDPTDHLDGVEESKESPQVVIRRASVDVLAQLPCLDDEIEALCSPCLGSPSTTVTLRDQADGYIADGFSLSAPPAPMVPPLDPSCMSTEIMRQRMEEECLSNREKLAVLRRRRSESTEGTASIATEGTTTRTMSEMEMSLMDSPDRSDKLFQFEREFAEVEKEMP